jgi:hypothetical protein
MKEKNLRCKFGKIETSNVGNVNQEGTQEDIIRSPLPAGLAKSEARADTLRYLVAVTYRITSGSYSILNSGTGFHKSLSPKTLNPLFLDFDC